MTPKKKQLMMKLSIAGAIVVVITGLLAVFLMLSASRQLKRASDVEAALPAAQNDIAFLEAEIDVQRPITDQLILEAEAAAARYQEVMAQVETRAAGRTIRPGDTSVPVLSFAPNTSGGGEINTIDFEYIMFGNAGTPLPSSDQKAGLFKSPHLFFEGNEITGKWMPIASRFSFTPDIPIHFPHNEQRHFVLKVDIADDIPEGLYGFSISSLSGTNYDWWTKRRSIVSPLLTVGEHAPTIFLNEWISMSQSWPADQSRTLSWVLSGVPMDAKVAVVLKDTSGNQFVIAKELPALFGGARVIPQPLPCGNSYCPPLNPGYYSLITVAYEGTDFCVSTCGDRAAYSELARHVRNNLVKIEPAVGTSNFPDLIPIDIIAKPSVLIEGKPVEFTVKVKNIGTAMYYPQFGEKHELRNETGNNWMMMGLSIDSLAHGKTADSWGGFSAPFNAKCSKEGTPNVFVAVLDKENLVRESDETNNILKKTFICKK